MNKETEITVTQTPTTGISIFDQGSFSHMIDIAGALAKTSMVPESLKGKSFEETKGNLLLVVEQAARWGFSPFAVMGSASVIRGRLMWEGKVIAAAITAHLGTRLRYDYSGTGENMKVVVSGLLPGDEEPRTIQGTVSEWKTTRDGSPWSSPRNYPRQLAYRGAREWARIHAPEVILGIYADDEFEDRREMRQAKGSEVKVLDEPAPLTPQAKTDDEIPAEEETPPFDGVHGYLGKVEHSTGETSGREWHRYRVTFHQGDEEFKATTFSTRVGKKAQELQGTRVVMMLQDTAKGTKLIDLRADGPEVENPQF